MMTTTTAVSGRNVGRRMFGAAGVRRFVLVQIAGAALMINFAVVAAACIQLRVQEQVWWMSHVALLVGGTGLLLRSPILMSTALAGVLVPHALWIVDWICGFGFGVHPLGVTHYLHDAGVLMWVKTLHHFYLVPALLWAVALERRYAAGLVPTAVGLFIVLTLVSRLLLPPASNVNDAFQILPRVDSPLIAWLNQLDGWRFMVVLNAGAFFVVVLPADMVIRRVTGAAPLGARRIRRRGAVGAEGSGWIRKPASATADRWSRKP
jgi:hypothetical protein